jgi:hemerythrin
MTLVKWTENYSIGVYVFDVEHRQFLALINDLYDAMLSGISEKDILTILSGLTTFAEGHFAHEEEFFAVLHYAGGEAHRLDHQRFLVEIQMFKEWCGNRDVRSIAIDLSAFLTKWFTEHTLGLDREFCMQLRKLGIR